MKINEKTGLYGNYGMWHVPFWQTKTFCIVVKVTACFIALVIVIVLYRAYKNYQKRKKVPAWTVALQELHQLKKDHKTTAEQGEQFYVAISLLLKKYLHARFGYDVLGKTDDEVVVCLEQHQCDPKVTEKVRKILQGGVIIKFANAKAVQEQISDDYALAIAIIKQTTPKEKK